MNAIIKNEFQGWHLWEVAWLVAASITVCLASCFFKDSPAAVVASIFGIAASVLTGKGKLSAYVIGGISRVLYAFIALKACFYGEVMLNLLYFVPMEFYGIYVWSHNMNRKTHEVKKRSMSSRQICLLTMVITVCTIGYGFWLKQLGGALPFLDSFTNVISIIAMIVTIKMYAQTWVLWLLVNAVSIVMWVISYKAGTGSIAILLLWCIYFVNSLIMLIKWARECKN